LLFAYHTQGQGLLSQRRNNASYFYHYDGLGSTKALTDANQNIQSTTKYDAWGNILQASGTITNPYLYVGELGYYGDGDAGMYLLTQRWYNPVIGRFAASKNLGSNFRYYNYAGNNPTVFTSSNGLPTGGCPGYSCWVYQCLGGPPSRWFSQNALQTFQQCVNKCLGEIFYGVNAFGNCLRKCIGDKLKGDALDLAATLACCLYYYYAHIPTNAGYINPCLNPIGNPNNPYYSPDACQECCDFKYCKCLVTTNPQKWLKCYVDYNKCYINCNMECLLR
jgi:RHS repeat-associated protein